MPRVAIDPSGPEFIPGIHTPPLTARFEKFGSNVRCDETPLWKGKVSGMPACRDKCTNDERCDFYAYWTQRKYCEIYDSCQSRSADGSNLILLYARIDECKLVIADGNAPMYQMIVREFPDGIIRPFAPRRNVHCACISRNWMTCAIYVRPSSEEELAVNTRLTRHDSRTLKPFFNAFPSIPGQAPSPVCLEYDDATITQKIFAEIEVYHPTRCIDLDVCRNGTPRGICPTEGTEFKSGEAVFILQEDQHLASEGKPVRCISVIGLRKMVTFQKKEPTQQELYIYKDPFGREEGRDKPFVVGVDYLMFFQFDAKDRAEGICQDESGQSEILKSEAEEKSEQPGDTDVEPPDESSGGAKKSKKKKKKKKNKGAGSAEVEEEENDADPSSPSQPGADKLPDTLPMEPTVNSPARPPLPGSSLLSELPSIQSSPQLPPKSPTPNLDTQQSVPSDPMLPEAPPSSLETDETRQVQESVIMRSMSPSFQPSAPETVDSSAESYNAGPSSSEVERPDAGMARVFGSALRNLPRRTPASEGGSSSGSRVPGPARRQPQTAGAGEDWNTVKRKGKVEKPTPRARGKEPMREDEPDPEPPPVATRRDRSSIHIGTTRDDSALLSSSRRQPATSQSEPSGSPPRSRSAPRRSTENKPASSSNSGTARDDRALLSPSRRQPAASQADSSRGGTSRLASDFRSPPRSRSAPRRSIEKEAVPSSSEERQSTSTRDDSEPLPPSRQKPERSKPNDPGGSTSRDAPDLLSSRSNPTEDKPGPSRIKEVNERSSVTSDDSSAPRRHHGWSSARDDSFSSQQSQTRTGKSRRVRAVVLKINYDRGYGFLNFEGEDVFFNTNDILGHDIRHLKEGDKVLCDIGPSPSNKSERRKAIGIKVLRHDKETSSNPGSSSAGSPPVAPLQPAQQASDKKWSEVVKPQQSSNPTLSSLTPQQLVTGPDLSFLAPPPAQSEELPFSKVTLKLRTGRKGNPSAVLSRLVNSETTETQAEQSRSSSPEELWHRPPTPNDSSASSEASPKQQLVLRPPPPPVQRPPSLPIPDSSRSPSPEELWFRPPTPDFSDPEENHQKRPVTSDNSDLDAPGPLPYAGSPAGPSTLGTVEQRSLTSDELSVIASALHRESSSPEMSSEPSGANVDPGSLDSDASTGPSVIDPEAERRQRRKELRKLKKGIPASFLSSEDSPNLTANTEQERSSVSIQTESSSNLPRPELLPHPPAPVVLTTNANSNPGSSSSTIPLTSQQFSIRLDLAEPLKDPASSDKPPRKNYRSSDPPPSALTSNTSPRPPSEPRFKDKAAQTSSDEEHVSSPFFKTLGNRLNRFLTFIFILIIFSYFTIYSTSETSHDVYIEFNSD